jgi:rod shape determining protein RodA
MKLIRRFCQAIFAHLDVPLMLVVLALLGIGLMTVFSATSSDGFDKLDKQVINMAVSAAIMLLIARTPPQTLMRFAVPVYVLGVILLLGVALFGIVVNGSRRWISLGFVRIQPSEIMKNAMPLMLAWRRCASTWLCPCP